MERRRWKREKLECKVNLRVSNEVYEGEIQNIGGGGIGIIINKQIGEKIPLAIVFNLPDNLPEIIANGLTMWTSPTIHQGNEVYRAGIQFTEIHENDRKRIIDFVEKRGAFLKEKRAFKRHELDGTIKYKIGQEFNFGRIRDIGLGGLCLIVNKKLNVGDEIKLELDVPKTPITFVASGEVVWSQRTAERWSESYSIGIKFKRIDESNLRKLIDYAQKKKK